MKYICNDWYYMNVNWNKKYIKYKTKYNSFKYLMFGGNYNETIFDKSTNLSMDNVIKTYEAEMNSNFGETETYDEYYNNIICNLYMLYRKEKTNDLLKLVANLMKNIGLKENCLVYLEIGLSKIKMWYNKEKKDRK